MPVRFIAVTEQFLKNIDIVTNELFNLAVSIGPKEIFQDHQGTDSQTLIDDPNSIAYKITFFSQVLEKLHDIKRSDIEIKQIDIIDCLIEIYKLVASIENVSYWRQLKDGQAEISSLHAKAQETTKLCERLERCAAANLERYRLASEFGIHEIERKLADLVKEVEMQAHLFEASYADLLQKINSLDDSTNITNLIRERNKLASDEKQVMQRLVNKIDDFYKNVPVLINSTFEQLRAQILEGLYDHMIELKTAKRNIYKKHKDQNYKANEALQAMQEQVNELLDCVRELDAVWFSNNREVIDLLVLLRGTLTEMRRPEMTDNELFRANINQMRLLDEQKRENLAMQIKECKQLLERVDDMFAESSHIRSERIKARLGRLKNICETRIMGDASCSAVDDALSRFLDRRAIERKKFNHVNGELFFGIREAFKQTREFGKFQKYLENHSKKRDIFSVYLTEIDQAENLQQLYKLLGANFFVSEQPGVGLRDNTARRGCYPFFHRGNSSTTETLLNDLENALTTIVHSFEPSEAANNSQYNHVSRNSK